MIGPLSHVGIAVPDLEAAIRRYRARLGAEVTAIREMAEHGVRLAFVLTSGSRIELLSPLGQGTTLDRFLERHPEGGLHHLCFEVDDLDAAARHLVEGGARILGDGVPRLGAMGLPVLFVHPKDFCGTLIELEQRAVSETAR